MAEDGTALLEKAAGQGHAYAMIVLRDVHYNRKEYEQAMKWATKSAEAGVPRAMFDLGALLDEGEGEGAAAPDHPAAAGWYRRAVDAGHAGAATNLCRMYTLGRGWAWQKML